jgi:hypothetical protein
VVEPLEETRTEFTFATEPVLSSLHLSIPGSLQYSPLVELDEVEVSDMCNYFFYVESMLRMVHCRFRKVFCSCARALYSCIPLRGSYTQISLQRAS